MRRLRPATRSSSSRPAPRARLYTSGRDKGRIDLNLKLDAEVAANLGLLTFGPEVTGTAKFVVTVTLDQEHGYAPSHLKVTGSAGYNGDLGDSDVVLKPTEGQIKDIQDALKGGRLESAAVGSTDGSRQQVEFTADLDLTTAQERSDALGLFTADPGAAANLVAALDEQGRLTLQQYDITSSKTEAGLKVGLGVGVGVGAEGDQTRDDRDLGASWVREPGGGWAVRACGLPS